MHGDDVGRVEHQHSHAVTWTNADVSQPGRELADALLQRAVAQHLARAQQRRMGRAREFEPVQQAIFDGIHTWAATTSTTSTAGCAVGRTRASFRPALSNSA